MAPLMLMMKAQYLRQKSRAGHALPTLAPTLQAGGHWFESSTAHWGKARKAAISVV
jgi:hypothetical protein